jgi:hypothetical protein
LRALGVVHGGRLARFQHVQVDAELRKPVAPRLQADHQPADLVTQGGGVGDVDDEPIGHRPILG